MLTSVNSALTRWKALRSAHAIATHIGFRHGVHAFLAGLGLGKRTKALAEEPANTAAASSVRRSLADTLVDLATHYDIETHATALTLALPSHAGDLDPRAAPIALARFGLLGRWEQRILKDLHHGDLPACVELSDGGYLLVIGHDGDDRLRVATPEGGQVTLRRIDLADQISGRVLLVGHSDPVNGAIDADDREAIIKGPRRWILSRFLSDQRIITQLLIAGLLLNLCSLAMPLFQRAIYDRVIPNLAIESMWALCVGVVVALGFEFALKQVRADFVEAQGLGVAHQIQARVMSAMLGARLEKAPRNSGAVLVALRDIESMALIAPSAIVTFFIDIPFFFVYVFVIWTMAGAVALSVLVGAIVITVIGLASLKGVGTASARGIHLLRARNNLAVDITDGYTTIKANQAEGKFLKHWTLLSDHMAINGHTTRKWSDMAAAATGFTVQAVTVLTIIIGVMMVKAGDLTSGALIAATLLGSRAMGPITGAIALITRAYQSLSQFKTVAELLALPPERDDPRSAITSFPKAGSFDLRAVGLAYSENDGPALSGVTLQIRKGERIALIGRTGSGKTTLLQLLGGLMAPTEGRVLIDGHNMSHYRVEAVRSQVAYAGQDACLFDTTLRENLTLGLSEIDPAALERAVKLSGVDSLAASLPDGFSTKLGPRGSRLSGGQRQAVLLARALARPCNTLLLDEPTASMDIGSEQRVLAGLADAISDGRTFVMATHRMDLLNLVERVIWLEGGKVIADKPRDEVLAMFRSQSKAA